MRLLMDGVVSEVHLNDYDPRIAAFWRSVLEEPDRFAEAMMTVPVNTEEWTKQREICVRADVSQPFELGFATFYLNRCNRSGVILGAAPIGGYDQEGLWKLDARFYRESLAERVRIIASKREQIHLTNLDALKFLKDRLPRGKCRERIFVYLDPPYHSKGSRLYMNSYQDSDHKDLARYIQRQQVLRWVMSYDDTTFIRGLYADCNVSDNPIRYSLQRKRKANELLIAPHHVEIPDTAYSGEYVEVV